MSVAPTSGKGTARIQAGVGSLRWRQVQANGGNVVRRQVVLARQRDRMFNRPLQDGADGKGLVGHVEGAPPFAQVEAHLFETPSMVPQKAL